MTYVTTILIDFMNARDTPLRKIYIITYEENI